jgi:hypothetical protein
MTLKEILLRDIEQSEASTERLKQIIILNNKIKNRAKRQLKKLEASEQ